MQKIHLPHIVLPSEFINLLTSHLALTSSGAAIFDVIRPNQALYNVLENSFKEFDDGRGLEKTMTALGWSNFRDRMASLYVHKTIHGEYPNKTSMELVDEIKDFENRYIGHSVQSHSRVFLLGFYLKLANIQVQKRSNNKFLEIKLPEELGVFLKLSQGRSEKTDWLILITLHLLMGLGDKLLMNSLVSGKSFNELYFLLSSDYRKMMMNNLLGYGASIKEQDIFIYDKV